MFVLKLSSIKKTFLSCIFQKENIGLKINIRKMEKYNSLLNLMLLNNFYYFLLYCYINSKQILMRFLQNAFHNILTHIEFLRKRVRRLSKSSVYNFLTQIKTTFMQLILWFHFNISCIQDLVELQYFQTKC